MEKTTQRKLWEPVVFSRAERSLDEPSVIFDMLSGCERLYEMK